jgi:tetratricopeptide (TPR) repeat protein
MSFKRTQHLGCWTMAIVLLFMGYDVPVVQAAAQSADDGARLYPGLGSYQRPVSTNSREAQQWFNQAIQLLYGFNHDEAIRSFHRAADADPDCAMAWWGISYAHGLHINNPEMSEQQSQKAFEAAQEAQKRIAHASPVEEALIRAVARRYEWPAPEDRRHLDEAYAAAMEQAWREHPDDPDVGALFAESLMNLQPWDLWTHEGEPKGRTEEIVAALERVLELDENHPGANHFYIHAVEASPTPERALAAADRLAGLVPGSGHLVHMPSHIYVRTGRYAQAADSNEQAIEVDKAYFAVAPPPGFYTLYYVHNLHFLAYAAMMEGRYDTAMRAARQLESEVPEEFVREYVTLADGLMPTTLHVMVRFGKWEDILREPAPPDFRLLSQAMRHYARGVALAALGRTEEGRAELAAFDKVAEQVTEDWLVMQNKAVDVLPIARHMLEGELLYREGDHDQAFDLLRKAVAMEESLIYDEPPGWMQPVRHALGALLMAADRADEAEKVYRADLERHPNNGWSILGLDQALRAQARSDDADALEPQLAAAFERADVQPTSSCYCEP